MSFSDVGHRNLDQPLIKNGGVLTWHVPGILAASRNFYFIDKQLTAYLLLIGVSCGIISPVSRRCHNREHCTIGIVERISCQGHATAKRSLLDDSSLVINAGLSRIGCATNHLLLHYVHGLPE